MDCYDAMNDPIDTANKVSRDFARALVAHGFTVTGVEDGDYDTDPCIQLGGDYAAWHVSVGVFGGISVVEETEDGCFRFHDADNFIGVVRTLRGS